MANVKNWSEADLVLKEISELQLKKEKIENEMNSLIAETKLEYGLEVEPLQAKIKELSQELQEFVESNKEDYDGKSKQLNFGRVGHRSSTRFKVPSKEEAAIIAKLKERGMNDCVKEKLTRKVYKTALKNYDEKLLAEIGIIKVDKNNFYYDIDKKALNF
jgi:phage host-nuclease inhibitor protein Gam